MGAKKITGTVLRKTPRYIHIVRDGRDCYDYLSYDGAAKYLSKDQRFSIYVDVVATKRVSGRNIYIYSNATLEKDGEKTYPIYLNAEELNVLYHIVIRNYEYMKKNHKDDKKTEHLNSILNKIMDMTD